VDTDPQMESVLSGRLGNVLVGADTSSFESLARKLFVLVGDKVSTEGEIIDGGTLPTQVEDPDLILTSGTSRESGSSREDLGIRDTPVVSRLWIWLVLAVPVAASWSTTHLGVCKVS